MNFSKPGAFKRLDLSADGESSTVSDFDTNPFKLEELLNNITKQENKLLGRKNSNPPPKEPDQTPQVPRYLLSTTASSLPPYLHSESERVRNSYRTGSYSSLKKLPDKLQCGQIDLHRKQQVIDNLITLPEHTFRPAATCKTQTTFQPFHHVGSDYNKEAMMKKDLIEEEKIRIDSYARKPFVTSSRIRSKYEEMGNDAGPQVANLGPGGGNKRIESLTRDDLLDEEKYIFGRFHLFGGGVKSMAKNADAQHKKIFFQKLKKRLSEKIRNDFPGYKFRIKWNNIVEEVVVQFLIPEKLIEHEKQKSPNRGPASTLPPPLHLPSSPGAGNGEGEEEDTYTALAAFPVGVFTKYMQQVVNHGIGYEYSLNKRGNCWGKIEKEYLSSSSSGNANTIATATTSSAESGSNDLNDKANNTNSHSNAKGSKGKSSKKEEEEYEELFPRPLPHTPHNTLNTGNLQRSNTSNADEIGDVERVPSTEEYDPALPTMAYQEFTDEAIQAHIAKMVLNLQLTGNESTDANDPGTSDTDGIPPQQRRRSRSPNRSSISPRATTVNEDGTPGSAGGTPSTPHPLDDKKVRRFSLQRASCAMRPSLATMTEEDENTEASNQQNHQNNLMSSTRTFSQSAKELPVSSSGTSSKENSKPASPTATTGPALRRLSLALLGKGSFQASEAFAQSASAPDLAAIAEQNGADDQSLDSFGDSSHASQHGNQTIAASAVPVAYYLTYAMSAPWVNTITAAIHTMEAIKGRAKAKQYKQYRQQKYSLLSPLYNPGTQPRTGITPPADPSGLGSVTGNSIEHNPIESTIGMSMANMFVSGLFQGGNTDAPLRASALVTSQPTLNNLRHSLNPGNSGVGGPTGMKWNTMRSLLMNNTN
jgi:hypothetical protein